MSDSYLDMHPSELERHFLVAGRFYEVRGTSVTYLCRDLLEIRRLKSSAAIGCDAVFIMMNPGSSEPLAEVARVELRDAALVPTNPDTTQYQLMRLMGVQGWERVKVLNLSDLRVARSQNFFERFKAFEDQERHCGHSIFSKGRKDELVFGLGRKPGGPIVAAWGVNPALKKLANDALQALSSDSILGLRHENGHWAYRHPLPRTTSAQARWRREALNMLRASCPIGGQ